MKIESIGLTNFAGIQEFRTNISPNVTYFVASNGGGKSTAGVTGIHFILKGIAERDSANNKGVLKGSRFRFIGPYGDSAEGELVLRDKDGVEYVISRKMTADKQQLTIAASDGRSLDQGWINDFWNELLLSPLAFSRLSGKEQAQMLGIDISGFEAVSKELKEAAKLIRHDIKSFGEVEVPSEKPEKVDVTSLIQEKNRILAFNKEQEEIAREREKLQNAIDSKLAEIKQLEERIAKLKEEGKEVFNKLQATPMAQGLIDTSIVDKKIETASEVNAAAAEYDNIVKKADDKSHKENELAENVEKQKANEQAKVDYLQSLELPFSTLTIDDDGGLLMEGRPVSQPYFSHGELIKICSTLVSRKNPSWKYLYIEDFDLLDGQKAQEILSDLLEKGFQVVCEKVSREKTDGVLVMTDL